MSTTTSMFAMPTKHTMIKAAVAGGGFGAAEYFILKNRNVEACAYNAAAIAGGILAISTVSETLLTAVNSPFVTAGTSMTGTVKGIEQRVLEIAGGAGAAMLLSQFVFKTQMTQRDMGMKLGMIVAGDLLGEAVADMMVGNSIDLFA